jgi:hypothetical protein
MEKMRISEPDCKRQCDLAVRECEEGSVHLEECESRWDDCISDCMSGCEIYY